MAKKKENLKEMKAADLEKKLATLIEQERSLRFKAEGARSKNVKELKNLKKDVARILTQLNSQK
ncbi:MAG: 50S ribosomal protein L29 [bacterium]|nr:50S ribosomal protein L29 [bacterium]